jgi:threonine aldolase
MIFASDNWAGAHPQIAAALAAHASHVAPAYGASDLDRQVASKFSEIFEREVAVFYAGTGTAANALSLSLLSRPGAVAFCHEEAHCTESECGAPEFFSGGSRLAKVTGPLGRIDPGLLEREIRRHRANLLHRGRPTAVTITQATEIGTVYSLEDIEAISRICRAEGMRLHMDGARFANALVALDRTPAEMTWKAGVDILSFGGTKNGCWCAEAIVLFEPALAAEMPYIHKRGAQLFSKSRFVSAQFEAYFEDGLWLDLARHANALARRLAANVRELRDGRARLAWEPEANEVFIVMTAALREKLRARGVTFHEWETPASFAQPLAADEAICRFVTSFATTPDEVDALGELL